MMWGCETEERERGERERERERKRQLKGGGERECVRKRENT